jgi:ATP-dependent Clp protease, protease subunit
MQFLKPTVATYCMGQAASAAAVLFSAGTKGHRHVLAHSRVLLHQPSSQGSGTISDLALQAAEIMRLRAETEDILSKHTGQSVERLRKDTDRDRIFTAREAVDYGLADLIVE